MNALAFTFLLGFAAAGASTVLRTVLSEFVDLNVIGISKIASWLLFNKPLTCDLCMSFWSTLGLAFFGFGTSFGILEVLAAMAVSTFALTAFKKLT